MKTNNRFNLKLMLLCALQICSISLSARWVWYQPAPVVVYQEPTVADAIVGGAFGIGCGIAAIVHHQKEKKQYKEYIQTFRDMGYTTGQAKIYAKMAMNNPEGLRAVVRSIDQEKLVQTKVIARDAEIEKLHDQNLQVKQESHDQKLQEMSHEYKLKLLTYLVLLLTTIIIFGIGFLLYRKR